ncbi:FadR/GntR family transcriptional regulator [Anaerotruncus rubiinfantis]|uniref:FadR/GntR family transcriptional regulator n=1 Tax=Anaerotruncus rubiinfantis TaxID=1720200 RepID=UPI0034A445E9
MSYNNNASQEVSDYIINNIQSGVWKPGDKIWSESEFCAHLDVSRIAVRDAIASLSAISVLKKVKGSGTYVEDPDNVSLEGIRCFLMKTEDMLELMEFRHIMDSYCTELFAERATEEEIRDLEECYYQMLQNYKNKERYDYFANEFHLKIARGCKNQFISKVMEYLRDSMLTHQNILSHEINRKKYQIGVTYHYRMLQMIKQRDSKMAGAYCRYHIRESMELFRKIVSENQKKAASENKSENK